MFAISKYVVVVGGGEGVVGIKISSLHVNVGRICSHLSSDYIYHTV